VACGLLSIGLDHDCDSDISLDHEDRKISNEIIKGCGRSQRQKTRSLRGIFVQSLSIFETMVPAYQHIDAVIGSN